MTQSTARTTFTKTVTYTFTADFPNNPGASAATLLTLAGGATNPPAGTTLSLGELLAKSTVAFVGNGGVSGAWSNTTPVQVEPYSMYSGARLMAIGDRISPSYPTDRLYVCTAVGTTTTEPVTSVAATALVAGTVYTITALGTSNFTLAGASGNTVGLIFTATANTTGTGTCSKSNWATTVGATTVNGATFMAINKFAVVANLTATTAVTYAVGVLFRSTTAEFLVTTGGLAVAGTALAAATPIGGTIASGAAVFTRVA